MSSTKKQRAPSPGEFFDRHLLRLASDCDGRNGGYFPVGPEPGLSTYYIQRRETAPRREDFEALESPDGGTLAAEFRKLWDEPEDTPLASLAEEFGALAESMAKKAEQTTDVSPYIYIMF
jgi:hypothetical protein